MTNKKIFFASAATSIILLSSSVLPAYAMLSTKLDSSLEMNASTKGLKASATLDTSAQVKADTSISARIKALTDLQTRVDAMVKVNTSEKSSLDTTIQNAISQMSTLKAKIDADSDNVTLKTDIQSITKSYRIYLLVLPQARITAAADRTSTTVDNFNSLSTKLQTRITAAQTAGKDTTSLTASLSDMNSKTADANVQAQAAISEVINLAPDNGDKTTFDSNQTTLKDARAKIKLGIADLKTARQDAGLIVKTLISFNIKTSASAQ